MAMKLFGHSDDELCKRENKLRESATALEKQKAELESQKTVLNHEKQLFEAQKTALDLERKELERDRELIENRRQAMLRLESAAKANFTEAQRKTFKEVIQSRLDACAAREKELAGYQSNLALREEAVSKREGEVADRELAVTQREQNADAGFADKVHAMADETERKEKLLAEESERLKKLAEELEERNRALEKLKGELVSRQAAVVEAESRKEADFADQRAKLARSLSEANQAAAIELDRLREAALAKQEKEIGDIRTERMLELGKAIDAERTRLMGQLESSLLARSQVADERERELDKRDAQLKDAQAKVDEERRAIDADKESHQRDVKRFEHEIERQQKRVDKRQENIDEEVNTRVEEECAVERADLAALREVIEQLKGELKTKGVFFERLDAFKRQFGDRDPAQVLHDLEETAYKLEQAHEELASRPTRESYDAISAKYTHLLGESKARESAWEESETLKREISRLEAEKSFVESECAKMEGRVKSSDALAEKYRTDLERLTASYAKESERDERIKSIRNPVFPDVKELPSEQPPVRNEKEWLDGILKSCTDYGIKFPKRILYAYHTALKTAEMSPIVVLAGVSGTGKSELPRLYSHFGGLFYEPVSVQPNWDSQEALLGFFNSIDDRFDAQRLLRFLSQSQENWSKDYPGLKERMCMVLLDEMNLAHPELYFAEFLSKFETRRGKSGKGEKKSDEIPSLEIKLGTKVDPWQLPLGRNVLWTGTMNQDETTKSLSDKVLDRAIVINFPRPRRLARRDTLKTLTDENRGLDLTWNTWKSWLSGKSAFVGHDDLISPYQKFLEGINDLLGVAGRAIGHRVWQSVEAYMSAYPGIREAVAASSDVVRNELMHRAFEDQLVQKVMPKLRGIDTRGDSLEKCLKPIRAKLQEGVEGIGKPFALDEDFDLAMRLGYGQFMWQSANYITAEDADA